MSNFNTNPRSLKLRRDYLRTRANMFDLEIQIENLGKFSIYRFFRGDNLLYSAVGLKEAFCWLNGFTSGFRSKDIK